MVFDRNFPFSAFKTQKIKGRTDLLQFHKQGPFVDVDEN